MKIPDLMDISPTNLLDLDERTACRNFLEKSLIEARNQFCQADFYANDLGWMGPVAFDFYVEAYLGHLTDCDPLKLDIVVPMSIVVVRSLMNEDCSNLLRLINKISELRTVAPRGDKYLEQEYDNAVVKIMEEGVKKYRGV